ncbi:MAG: hypothetical protein J1E65_08460 [Lachnospiraceae bacterium]|nr:hypothetical protein [Lachnospiraceae bacterium]
MREIGSEFWDVPVCNKENMLFPEYTQWFLSGRSALRAIIKDILQKEKIRTVAIPSWCCESMIVPFLDEGIEIVFYSVTLTGGFKQDISSVMWCDALLVMDYFGYMNSPVIEDFKGVIIRDLSHSVFFEEKQDADYYFGSLRKWCGVWTGGFAWSQDGYWLEAGNANNLKYVLLREKAMAAKSCYINKCLDESGLVVQDKHYLGIYREAEEMLDNCGIAPAAERDIRLAKSLDINFIRSCRRGNAEILMKAFPKQLIFSELNHNDCPLFVPIIVPDGKRNVLQDFLCKQDIYCPIHWPVSKYHCLDEKTQKLYTDEISLVCDQRYTQDDMERMIEAINSFYKE